MTDMILELKDSRHPVIERNLPLGETYIANDIYLDPFSTTDHYFNRSQYEW